MIERKRFWLAFAVCLSLTSAVLAATITVMVEQTQVRKRPQFYAPAVATVKLGDRLDAKDSESGWYAVSVADASGYVHSSAVTSKKVKLSSDKSIGAGGTSAEEITLAGKGFNNEVERSYQGQHPDVNFAVVDAMSHRLIPDGDVMEFMKEGALLPASGGEGQ